MDHFRLVSDHILRSPEADMASIRGCFPPTCLSSYNMRPTTFNGCPDIATAVQLIASKIPQNLALCFAKAISNDQIECDRVSYEELNKVANQIARLLKDLGASEGDVVSIIMEKSVLLYAGILGHSQAGCAYLPLLPGTPIARIGLILEQAGVRTCLADSGTQLALRHLSGNIIDVTSVDLSSYADSSIEIHPKPSRIANVVYTSGSTGTPKGVCVTQLNIMSNLDVLSKIYPVKDTSRLLQSCSQAFDVSVFEIFFAWTQGMCLCSAVNDVLFDDLENAIRDSESLI